MRRLWSILLLFAAPAYADDTLTIAVASNFLRTAQQVVKDFTAESGIAVRLSSGSTGKLFAQIVNGAPYDVFLSADEERPMLLVERGLALGNDRFTYAYGQLHLLAFDAKNGAAACQDGIAASGFQKLAIANPDTAPYGRAAREYLENSGLWSEVQPRIVFGENVAQVQHFVATGNAQLGLGAAANSPEEGTLFDACVLTPGHATYSPIKQQGVVLARTRMPEAAKRFARYLLSPEVRIRIAGSGYRVAEE